MGLTVRRLAAQDALVAARVVKTFVVRDMPIQYMERFLGNLANYLIVAEFDGEVVGFLLAYELERMKEDARMMFIYEIEVAAGCRRRGIGTALIEEVRDIAAREGMVHAFVITNYSDAGAVAFYRHTGAEIENGDDIVFRYSL